MEVRDALHAVDGVKAADFKDASRKDAIATKATAVIEEVLAKWRSSSKPIAESSVSAVLSHAKNYLVSVDSPWAPYCNGPELRTRLNAAAKVKRHDLNGNRREIDVSILFTRMTAALRSPDASPYIKLACLCLASGRRFIEVLTRMEFAPGTKNDSSFVLGVAKKRDAEQSPKEIPLLCGYGLFIEALGFVRMQIEDENENKINLTMNDELRELYPDLDTFWRREFGKAFTAHKFRDLYVAYFLQKSDRRMTEAMLARKLLLHSEDGSESEEAYLKVIHVPGRELFDGAKDMIPKKMPWEEEGAAEADNKRQLELVDGVRKKMKL